MNIKAQTFISKLDMTTLQEKVSQEQAQIQRPTCSHSQESHKNAKLIGVIYAEYLV